MAIPSQKQRPKKSRPTYRHVTRRRIGRNSWGQERKKVRTQGERKTKKEFTQRTRRTQSSRSRVWKEAPEWIGGLCFWTVITGNLNDDNCYTFRKWGAACCALTIEAKKRRAGQRPPLQELNGTVIRGSRNRRYCLHRSTNRGC